MKPFLRFGDSSEPQWKPSSTKGENLKQWQSFPAVTSTTKLSQERISSIGCSHDYISHWCVHYCFAFWTGSSQGYGFHMNYQVKLNYLKLSLNPLWVAVRMLISAVELHSVANLYQQINLSDLNWQFVLSAARLDLLPCAFGDSLPLPALSPLHGDPLETQVGRTDVFEAVSISSMNLSHESFDYSYVKKVESSNN